MRLGRLACKEEIKYRAKVGKYPPLLIFPEGALTNGKVLIQFRAGAFDAQVPVTPVVIEYPYDEASGWSAAGTNLGGDFASNFLALALQWHNRMKVTFLPKIVPDGDRFEFANTAKASRWLRKDVRA